MSVEDAAAFGRVCRHWIGVLRVQHRGVEVIQEDVPYRRQPRRSRAALSGIAPMAPSGSGSSPSSHGQWPGRRGHPPRPIERQSRGFSQRTCLPACNASTAICSCDEFGVAMVMTSMSSRASTSR